MDCEFGYSNEIGEVRIDSPQAFSFLYTNITQKVNSGFPNTTSVDVFARCFDILGQVRYKTFQIALT